jgi:hypothetical protein
MSCFDVVFNEDGSATALGRITARDGSGAATGLDGEGNFLQVADVSTITCNVYDLDSDTPDTAIITPTVTVATSVLDTVATTNVLWTKDSIGYNFIHDLPITAFPTGGNMYLVEYKITTAGGTVGFGRYKGIACPAHGS